MFKAHALCEHAFVFFLVRHDAALLESAERLLVRLFGLHVPVVVALAEEKGRRHGDGDTGRACELIDMSCQHGVHHR